MTEWLKWIELNIGSHSYTREGAGFTSFLMLPLAYLKKFFAQVSPPNPTSDLYIHLNVKLALITSFVNSVHGLILPLKREILPWWLRQESVCLQCGRTRFNPWVGKIWRRKWQPTPVFLPGNSHGQRSLVGYSPRGPKELDTTEWLLFFSFFLEIWELLSLDAPANTSI